MGTSVFSGASMGFHLDGRKQRLGSSVTQTLEYTGKRLPITRTKWRSRETEMSYDIFLMGYVNDLHSSLHVSERYPRAPAARIVSKPLWRAALGEAKVGLAMHRKASALAGAGHYSRAEVLVTEALQHVLKRLVILQSLACLKLTSVCSVKMAPNCGRRAPTFINFWGDESMLNCP